MLCIYNSLDEDENKNLDAAEVEQVENQVQTAIIEEPIENSEITINVDEDLPPSFDVAMKSLSENYKNDL